LDHPLAEQSRVPPYRFTSNKRPTIGVELELNLVDCESMALKSGLNQILEDLPEGLKDSVKPELFQCYIEIN
jgi:carboxylate-amine ligase